MLYIKFKYQYDAYQREYVLTSKICYNGHELSIWDTTTEETYTRAMQLANIDVRVDWDWDDEEENEFDEVDEPSLN